jgi:hypothetical protein
MGKPTGGEARWGDGGDGVGWRESQTEPVRAKEAEGNAAGWGGAMP